MINTNEITALYKAAFPQTEHEADSGYILRDGTVIDISSKGSVYCHGLEFQTEPALAEWRAAHCKELPHHHRQVADAVMVEIGAVEFTIDNMRMQCVRLPSGKPLTAEQRQPLTEIIGRILERGFIRVETLGTREYAEYDAKDYSAEDVMREIEARNL